MTAASTVPAAFADKFYENYVAAYPESWRMPHSRRPRRRRTDPTRVTDSCRNFVHSNVDRARAAVVHGDCDDLSMMTLAIPVNTVAIDSGQFGDMHDMWQRTLRRTFDDVALDSVAHRFAAQAATRLGRHDRASELIQVAMSAAERSADGEILVDCYYVRAWIDESAGDVADAYRHAMRALYLAREVGYVGREVDSLNAVGVHLHALGRVDDARRYCSAAVDLASAHGMRKPRLAALDSLAAIEAESGNHGAAMDLLVEVRDELVCARQPYHLEDVTERLHASASESARRLREGDRQ